MSVMYLLILLVSLKYYKVKSSFKSFYKSIIQIDIINLYEVLHVQKNCFTALQKESKLLFRRLEVKQLDKGK